MAIFRIEHMSNAGELDAPVKDYHTVSSTAIANAGGARLLLLDVPFDTHAIRYNEK
jgi:hypothetical protein